MKYTTEDALTEIMRRSEIIVLHRNCRALSGAAGALLCVLAVVVALLPGTTGAASAGSVYGSFLLSQEAGGYVLAAVVAFALGIVVTLLCLRYRSLKQREAKKTINHEKENLL
ncbi:MAG: hypothetical protein K5855_04965 [Oscillospiraceae bacterium]|nr:hypothetical protein [Oscillospiraceae bacterium]